MDRLLVQAEHRLYLPAVRTAGTHQEGAEVTGALLPIGWRVRSLRDPKIVGLIQGYGVLHQPMKRLVLNNNEDIYPTLVYLVWPDDMLGSSAKLNLYVHVLNSDQVEDMPL